MSSLRTALENARAGRGGLAFVLGEAGIGKSRLCDELAQEAGQQGVAVHWGRCWEAGGAPAFWPLIQPLRSLLRHPDNGGLLDELPGHIQTRLAQLLPELGPGSRSSAPTVGPQNTAFPMLDAICQLLTSAAARSALLLIIEDVHVADPSSVELLDFLAGTIRAAPLLVLGTLRDADVRPDTAESQMPRVLGQALTVPLSRLQREDVQALLAEAFDDPPDGALVDRVFATTEGHPLFVRETVQLLRTHGTETGTFPIPHNVEAAIGARLAELPVATVEALRVASTLGREVALDALASLLAVAPETLPAVLEPAIQRHVLVPWGVDRHRFSHILIREVLHGQLPAERREALHLACATYLEAQADEAAISAIAQHYLQAGRNAAARAAEATRRAAEQALSQLAFADAAALYHRALSCLEGTPRSAHAEIELWLGLGEAQLLSGEIDAGQTSCLKAAELARHANEPELLARAALAYGHVLLIGNVSATLIGLLQEALTRLPPGDNGLRAIVMGRLAAAQQPAVDPSGPIALARSAIDMARRVGDPRVLLETLRTGMSAMADLERPEVRAPLNREHMQLAERLGDPVETLRGSLRLVLDLHELGDLAAARAAEAVCQRLELELDHPHYRWRLVAMRAMRALFEGRFDDATRLRDEARALIASARDPNGQHVLVMQEIAHARLVGDHARALSLTPSLANQFVGADLGHELLELQAVGERVRAGDGPLAPPSERALATAVSLGDRTSQGVLLEIAHALGDRELTRRVLDRGSPKRDHWVHGGMLGMTLDGPIAASLAKAQATLGDHEQAVELFQHALTLAQTQEARPHGAWLHFDYGTYLVVRGRLEEAHQQLTAAAREAKALGMHGLERRASAELASLDRDRPTPAPEPKDPGHSPPTALVPQARVTLERDGEMFRCTTLSGQFHVRSTKGIQILARLMTEPGREFHVLELSAPGGALDTGHAGEAIDDQAKEHYRSRAQALRAELQEAEDNQDRATIERCREELAFLEAELSRALGLGGRARREGSASERARVNVQRRIKDAINRLTEHEPSLKAHLEWAVRTGMLCSYSPE